MMLARKVRNALPGQWRASEQWVKARVRMALPVATYRSIIPRAYRETGVAEAASRVMVHIKGINRDGNVVAARSDHGRGSRERIRVAAISRHRRARRQQRADHQPSVRDRRLTDLTPAADPATTVPDWSSPQHAVNQG